MRRRRLLAAALFLPAAKPALAAGEAPSPRTDAISLLAPPALPVGFRHFPYADPDAPKGGEAALGSLGSFDSFNPFIIRGTPAAGINLVWDTLLRSSADEANTMYGHLARGIAVAPDNRGVTFELRPEARFHDGTPVTAEDVAWSFDTLRAQGRPNYRIYWADVADARVDGPGRVTFRFKTDANRELPQILGQLPVLPKHWWQGRDFAQPLTEPPLGSGPYRVGRFEFGRTVAFERVPNWWAADTPTGRGLHNIGTLRYEYFRDATVALEAFKSGQVDFREENIAKNWATEYDFPAARRGLVRKEDLADRLPTGMQGFLMNARRPQFRDRRVREAMDAVFDFEWLNRNLFYGAYTRTLSYYSNSDLASSGVPQGDELALLQPFRDRLPPELFTTPFTLPVTDGSGNNREGLRRALTLLREAGYAIKERRVVDPSGAPFGFEILLPDPSYERLAVPYAKWLGDLGVNATVRTVDPAQYQRRMDSFDYDVTIGAFPESDHPGNEQADFWGCGSAKAEGGQNLLGICDPAVEALVAQVIAAPDYPHLLAATRALDRVLLWGWYLVPHYHLTTRRVASWDRFGRVPGPLRSGYSFDAWWVDPARAAATDAARRAGG